MKIITLRALTDEDINLISQWLNAPHILRWYEDPAAWLHEIENRNGEFSFISHFITLSEGLPIGFCQYYDCFDAQEDWYSVNEKGKIYSIDYLIGNTKFLRKGLGKATILALEAEICKTGANAIIVQPDSENTASNKTLISCGYKFDTNKGYYRKNLGAGSVQEPK